MDGNQFNVERFRMDCAELMTLGLSRVRDKRCELEAVNTRVSHCFTAITFSVSLEIRFCNSTYDSSTCRLLSHLTVTDHFFLRLDKAKNRKHPNSPQRFYVNEPPVQTDNLT